MDHHSRLRFVLCVAMLGLLLIAAPLMVAAQSSQGAEYRSGSQARPAKPTNAPMAKSSPKSSSSTTDNTSSSVKRSSGSPKQPLEKLNLVQAVEIAVTRNLRMADDRLAIREKESQRREAFSDFFPSIDLQYTAAGYRYQQGTIEQLFSWEHPGRYSYRPRARTIGGLISVPRWSGLSLQDRPL